MLPRLIVQNITSRYLFCLTFFVYNAPDYLFV